MNRSEWMALLSFPPCASVDKVYDALFLLHDVFTHLGSSATCATFDLPPDSCYTCDL